jgi:hypothetical protein
LAIKAAQATFFSDLIDRLKRIPGVHKVGATSGLPLTGGLPDGMFLLMTQDEAPKNVNNTDSLARQFDIFSRQKESASELLISASRPMGISRLLEFRFSADAPSRSTTARILRMWP